MSAQGVAERAINVYYDDDDDDDDDDQLASSYAGIWELSTMK